MGQVSSLFVHKVVAVAMADAPDHHERRRDLLASVGLKPDAPIDPKVMVQDTAYYSLCEEVARGDRNGASVPIRVGSLMRCDDYGAFGLAWKSAVNLRGSFERAVRYGRVLTSVARYEVLAGDGALLMVLHRAGERRLGLRLSNEQTLVAITEISREVSGGDFCPEAVFFRHPAPGDISAHEDYFGCPVHFDADRDAVRVSAARARQPNRLGDAQISRFFDAHMERELAGLPDNSGLTQRVRIQVSQHLSEGVPALSAVAGALGMSARTMQRRLAEQGRTYQDVVDLARRELAERLLRDTDYSLIEIAFLTGFSDQSAFTRAFKRWSGQTPRSYRLPG